MILGALPASIAPMVTTPKAAGSFSRLMTVCTSSIKRAAMTTGSIVRSGIAPWPPRPLKVISSESAVVVVAPKRHITVPANVPVVQIGPGKRGPITAAIQQSFFDYINGVVPDRHGWLRFVDIPVAKKETVSAR